MCKVGIVCAGECYINVEISCIIHTFGSVCLILSTYLWMIKVQSVLSKLFEDCISQSKVRSLCCLKINLGLSNCEVLCR
jgi:hypothetical protein